MPAYIQINTIGCNTGYSVRLPTPSSVGSYITVQDNGLNPSFFASNAIVITTSGYSFFSGNTSERIQKSGGALTFVSLGTKWRLVNNEAYMTTGNAYLREISTTQLILRGPLSPYGELIVESNVTLTGGLDTQTPPTVQGIPVIFANDLISTVQGLGSLLYISSISYVNTSIVSTVNGLGDYGAISSLGVQSTVAGLGSLYMSTDSVTSTFKGLGSYYISTPSLVSYVQGLGSSYISTYSLFSTVEGLGKWYISTDSLTSTVFSVQSKTDYNAQSIFQNLGNVYLSPDALLSSVVGLSNVNPGYISQGQFSSTIVGLGNAPGNSSSSDIVSTINGLWNIGYISMDKFISTTKGISSNTDSNVSNQLSSLGSIYISSLSLQSTVNNLGLTYYSQSNLTSTGIGLLSIDGSNLISTVVNLGNYYTLPEQLISTTLGISAVSATSIESTTQGINTIYISPSVVQSTVAGLGSIGYISASQLTSTATGLIPIVSATRLNLYKIAGFALPRAIAYSTVNSNIYVCSGNAIQQITLSGVVTTLVGKAASGFINGTGSSASFYSPSALCFDTTGLILYVADTGNNSVRKIILSTSNVSTFTTGLSGPRGVACDTTNLYVSDSGSHLIRKYALSSASMTILAGSSLSSGTVDGTGINALFNSPRGLTLDSSLSRLYVADYSNYAVRQITLPAAIVTTYMGICGQPGVDSTHLTGPTSTAFDSSGTLYISDSVNNCIYKWLNTTTSTLTTTVSSIRIPTNYQITATYTILSIIADSFGNIFCGLGTSLIKIDIYSTITVVAGVLGGEAFVQDGQGASARFYRTGQMVIDGNNNIYMLDYFTLRKIDTSYTVTTVVGLAGNAGLLDGQGVNARLYTYLYDYRCHMIYSPTTQYIYIIDFGWVIRSIDTSFRVTTLSTFSGISTVLATNTLGTIYVAVLESGITTLYTFNSSNNLIPLGVNSTLFSFIPTSPSLFSVDSSGNLYIFVPSSISGSTLLQVYKIYPPYTPSSYTLLYVNVYDIHYNPTDGVIAKADATGNVYIYSKYGNYPVVQVSFITGSFTVGVSATFAGSSLGYLDANGTNAKFYTPLGISFMKSLLVADSLNYTVRSIDSSSNVTTYAGSNTLTTNTSGITPVSIYNLPPPLLVPTAVVYSPVTLNIYACTGNLVRQITPQGSVSVTTLAGSTYPANSNDIGIKAKFNAPTALCLDTGGSILYVADTGNGSIRSVSLLTGMVSTFASNLNSPQGIECDTLNIYVSDTGNHVIKKYVISTSNMSILAGDSGTSGSTDGTGSGARFASPRGLAFDSTYTNLYVADYSNSSVRRLVVSSGQTTTYIRTSSTGTPFAGPTALTVATNGTMYITDTPKNCIVQSSANGTTTSFLTSFVGSTAGYLDANGESAKFNTPLGICKMNSSVVVADSSNLLLRLIDISSNVTTLSGTNVTAIYSNINSVPNTYISSPSLQSTVAGLGTFGYISMHHLTSTVYGVNTTGYISTPNLVSTTTGLLPVSMVPTVSTVNGCGNYYISSGFLQSDLFFVTTVPGSIPSTLTSCTTLNGTVYLTTSSAVYSYSPLTGIRLLPPTGVSITAIAVSSSNIYVIDQNKLVSFSLMDFSPLVLANTTNANGYVDSTTASTIQFSSPTSMVHFAGYLYMCDTQNDAVRRVQVSPLSSTTIVSLPKPSGIVIDASGLYLYVSTQNGFIYKVSVIDKTYVQVSSGLTSLGSVLCFDPTNTFLYITNISGKTVLQVNINTGVSTPFAGSGSTGSVDAAGLSASFSSPKGVVFNSTDKYLYVIDNTLLRRITTQIYHSTSVGIVLTAKTIQPYSTSLVNPIHSYFLTSNTTTPVVSLANSRVTVNSNIDARGYTVTASKFTTKGLGGGPNYGFYYGDSTYVTSISDRRLKEDIQTISSPLEKISALQAIRYRLIDNPSQQWIGYIAQDVESILPEIVQTDDSPALWKSIQYTHLPALCIEGVKELKKKYLRLESLLRGTSI